MNGIVQSALGGGRALLVGWILPSLINVLILGLVVLPRVTGFAALTGAGDATRATVVGLVGTAVLGLLLAAVQTPLYRLLEGYLGWPRPLYQAGRRRQLSRKHLLRNRLDAAFLAGRETSGTISYPEHQTLQQFRAHPVTRRYVDADLRRGPVWLNLLDERLHRYPVDDEQVTPTRLGNAIRRFEEYGFDRFRLDSQVLWHELTAVVGESTRKQVEDARTTVDFFVCLLFGHLLVALSAAVALATHAAPRPWLVVVVLAGLLVRSLIWFRVAVAATDDWAGAVRAMVNLGRRPLAESLGLVLPASIDDERVMWMLAGKLAEFPFQADLSGALNRFRAPAVTGSTGQNGQPSTGRCNAESTASATNTNIK